MTDRGAFLSDDGRWRWLLWRTLEPQLGQPDRNVVFVMLNPSTADADHDDPTIRRCMSFARREGGTRLEVVNLWPYRATDPEDLLTFVRSDDYSAPASLDAFQWNDRTIRQTFEVADLVIAAWGATAPEVTVPVVAHIRDHAERTGVELRCLGTTAGGHPRHPLYLRGDAPLTPWPEGDPRG